MAPCASGALLLGLETWPLSRGDRSRRPPPRRASTPLPIDVEADLPTTRVNDGRTDRAGNFVFGTMNQAEGHPAIGSFYQWSARHGLRRLDLPRVGIANSICFSPDGTTMYLCDSPRRRSCRAPTTPTRAAVTGIQPFASLEPDGGQPDGSIVDADGYLWNAAWGAGLVRRYRPDGKLDREVAVPAKNPTCVVFGGPALNELYITSARQETSEEELARTPEVGGVYRVAIKNVRGLPDRLFAD